MGSQHGHGLPTAAHGDRRRLVIALGITLGAAVLGGAGALLTGSLALLADLGHLLTDAGALAAAFVASLLAVRPRTSRRTFGSGRAEVLVAALNAIFLVVVVAWVVIEAFGRLSTPADVPGLPMLIIGALGLAGNVAALLVLAGGDRQNMNLRGAAMHVLGDALGSVGVLAAAIVVLTTGWPYADTVASLLIVALIVPRAVGLLREATHLLLEGVPDGIDVDEVHRALLAVPDVIELHDLHVWAINDRSPAASVHLVVAQGTREGLVLDAAGAVLRERFGLHHVTLQIETPAHAGHETVCD